MQWWIVTDDRCFCPCSQNEGQLKCIATSGWNTSLCIKYFKCSLCSFKKWMPWKMLTKIKWEITTSPIMVKLSHWSKLKVAKNIKKIKGLSQKRQSKSQCCWWLVYYKWLIDLSIWLRTIILRTQRDKLDISRRSQSNISANRNRKDIWSNVLYICICMYFRYRNELFTTSVKTDTFYKVQCRKGDGESQMEGWIPLWLMQLPKLNTDGYWSWPLQLLI